MPDPDFASFGYGGAQYPLTASLTNSLLRDADPAVYYALEYFQSVITTYVGDRILAIAGAAPAITIPAAVVQKVPLDPSPFLQEQQFQFPLLALYRLSSDYSDRSVTYPHRVGEWGLDYILPPLNGGQMERVGPILKSVADVIHNRIENMFDPSFQSGLHVWEAAGLQSIYLMSDKFGQWSLGGNLWFPCWSAKLQVKERVTSVNPVDFDELTGIDAHEDLVTPGDDTIPDFVVISETFNGGDGSVAISTPSISGTGTVT